MTHDEQHAFAAADEADLAYRSLSTPAVVASVLAVLSGLVFVSPFFWGLPIAAAAVSLAAIRSIRSAGGARSGMTLAAGSLCLAVGVAAAAYARSVAVETGHQRAAGAVADEFLRRLGEGDLAGALELTVDYPERLPTAEAARVYYASDAEATGRLEQFRGKPVIAALEGVDPPPLERTLGVELGRFGELIATRRYAPPEGVDRAVRLTLRRRAPRAGLATAWRVTEFEFAD